MPGSPRHLVQFTGAYDLDFLGVGLDTVFGDASETPRSLDAAIGADPAASALRLGLNLRFPDLRLDGLTAELRAQKALDVVDEYPVGAENTQNVLRGDGRVVWQGLAYTLAL